MTAVRLAPLAAAKAACATSHINLPNTYSSAGCPEALRLDLPSGQAPAD